jgi:hypothetical protein
VKDEKALFKRLDRHCEILDQQNGIMRQILEMMPKPASKLTSVLEIVVLVVGVFSVVNIADTIMKWITGG